jgi:hypothetical protein
MAIQTLAGIVILRFGGVRCLNKYFGRSRVWLLSGIIHMVILGCCCFLGPNAPVLTIVVLMFGGIHYGIHGANIYVIVRDIVNDENKIGWAISMSNNTLTVAQILVGSLLGSIISCSGPNDGSLTPSSSHGTNYSNEFFEYNFTQMIFKVKKKRVVCPEVGTVMFKWVGFVGASLIVLLYFVDTCCLQSRTFGGKTSRRRRKSQSPKARRRGTGGKMGSYSSPLTESAPPGRKSFINLSTPPLCR